MVKAFNYNKERLAWGSFFLMFLILFGKLLLFHWLAFHSILFSSLWKETGTFIQFYLPKISVSLFLASFVFISKRSIITNILLIIIDIWAITNLMYYEANELFIDPPSILLVNNMTGFWDSLIQLFHWQFILFPLGTLLYLIFCVLIHKRHPNSFKKFLIISSICFVLYLIRMTPIWYQTYYLIKEDVEFDKEQNELVHDFLAYNGIKLFIPFYNNAYLPTQSFTYIPFDEWSEYYVRSNSIVHYFVSMCVYQLYATDNGYVLSDDQKKMLLGSSLVKQHYSESDNNLIIFLVESFESWTVKDFIENDTVMPYLYNFLQKNYDHILICDSIKSQVKNGVSGDGQMIVNTGLLPVTRGATCALYNQNVYPNFAHFFHKSVIFAPSPTWNQDEMTPAYQFQDLVIPKRPMTEESELFDSLNVYLKNIKSSFCVFFLTHASHTPFKCVEENNINSNLILSEHMPKTMRDYLECLNYSDSLMGKTFTILEETGLLSNTTIVITGDHTIFKKKGLENFKDYFQSNNMQVSYPSYTPLLIYSPTILEHRTINKISYQMDIYPTILHLISKDDYPWKGFGVNLLDSTNNQERSYTEEEAYRISEYLIESDYFKQFQDIIN